MIYQNPLDNTAFLNTKKRTLWGTQVRIGPIKICLSMLLLKLCGNRIFRHGIDKLLTVSPNTMCGALFLRFTCLMEHTAYIVYSEAIVLMQHSNPNFVHIYTIYTVDASLFGDSSTALYLQVANAVRYIVDSSSIMLFRRNIMLYFYWFPESVHDEND